MAMKTEVQVTGQAQVGGMDGGETVFIELRTATMGILVLKTPAHAWAKLVASFRAAGEVAAKMRAGPMPKDDPFEIVSPFRVTRASTGRATTGEVSIHFVTQEGIPIATALSAEQASALSEALAAEVQRPPTRPHEH